MVNRHLIILQDPSIKEGCISSMFWKIFQASSTSLLYWNSHAKISWTRNLDWERKTGSISTSMKLNHIRLQVGALIIEENFIRRGKRLIAFSSGLNKIIMKRKGMVLMSGLWVILIAWFHPGIILIPEHTLSYLYIHLLIACLL